MICIWSLWESRHPCMAYSAPLFPAMYKKFYNIFSYKSNINQLTEAISKTCRKLETMLAGIIPTGSDRQRFWLSEHPENIHQSEPVCHLPFELLQKMQQFPLEQVLFPVYADIVSSFYIVNQSTKILCHLIIQIPYQSFQISSTDYRPAPRWKSCWMKA